MNKTFTIIFFIILSLILIVVQSTILSPKNLGFLSPDLNLILIIALALLTGFKGGTILAFGNGYMMDILSGNLMGVNTLSRLSIFAIIRSTNENVYYHRIPVLFLAIFLSTIFLWVFIWIVIKFNSDVEVHNSFSEIFKNGLVNTVVGIPLFFLIKKFYERVQK